MNHTITFCMLLMAFVSIAQNNICDFGAVAIGTNINKNYTFQNKSNEIILLKTIQSNSYYFQTAALKDPIKLLPNEIYSFNIAFLPTQSFSYEGSIYLYDIHNRQVDLLNLRGVGTTVKKQAPLVIYPNPAKDFVRLYFNDPKYSLINISLWNEDGELLKQFEIPSSTTHEFDEILLLPELNKASYWIQVETEADVFMKKLILE